MAANSQTEAAATSGDPGEIGLRLSMAVPASGGVKNRWLARQHSYEMEAMNPHWKLGTVLYRKASPEEGGMLTGRIERPGNLTTYLVSWPEDGEMEHWEMELSDEKAL